MANAAEPLEIRPAQTSDCATLTRISFAAKRHWKYPEDYFEVWREELTITPEYIASNRVFVACRAAEAVAYYSLVQVEESFRAGAAEIEAGDWLDHMFVAPGHMGQGVGRQMAEHLQRFCLAEGIKTLRLLADPNAAGFYRKCGAVFIKYVPSNIPGRAVAYFEWKFM